LSHILLDMLSSRLKRGRIYKLSRIDDRGLGLTALLIAD
jgi:hypothetical protein